MNGPVWPPAPSEPPERESRNAAYNALFIRYKGLLRRQTREHVTFGLVAILMFILAQTVFQPPRPQLLRTLDFALLVVFSLVYLTYAGRLDEDIQAMRRELDEMREG